MKRVITIIIAIIATLSYYVLFMFPAEGEQGDDKSLRIKPTEDSVTSFGEKWAILIGIDKYEDIGINPLKYTVKDVEELYNAITTAPDGFKPDNVILMTPNASNPLHRPARSNLLAILNSWFKLAGENDTVLLYYSGHGIEQEGNSYILPQDAKISALKMTTIDTEYLKDTLRNSKAKKRILILDACHSGAGKGIDTMGKGLAKSIEDAQGLVTLASCDLNETSYEISDLKHGAFTYFLIEALKGKADRDKDGELWASEVNYYVWDNTRKWAAKNGLQQTPKYVSAVQGEIVLAKTYTESPTMGVLDVQVTPSDSLVTITPLSVIITNTEVIESKPLRIQSKDKKMLPIGTYRVTAEKEGYEPAIKEPVGITADASTQISFTLRPKLATITAPDLPSDARILVNDLLVRLPSEFPPGTYKVRVERDGFQAVEVSESLKSGQVFTLKPEWVPITFPPTNRPLSNEDAAPSIPLKNTPYLTALSEDPYGRAFVSLVLPGLGQHTQGRHTRGFVYEAIIFAAGVTTLWMGNHYQSTLDKYVDVKDRLWVEIKNQRGLTSEILTLLTDQEDAYNKARLARNLTIATQITLGVAWGINAIDAGMTKSLSEKRKVTLEINPVSKGGQVLLSLQF